VAIDKLLDQVGWVCDAACVHAAKQDFDPGSAARLDTYNVTGYSLAMIRSFRHKGLERFFTTGSKQGIRPEHAQRLRDILFRLQFANKPQDVDFPGSGLHPLKGKLKGSWSVMVSGNWRVIFRFDQSHAFEVDYVDYH